MRKEFPKLLILGAGGFGISIAETAKHLGQWSDIYFVDDRWPECSMVHDFKVISDINGLEYLDCSSFYAIAAVGNNQLRQQWHSRLKDLHIPLALIIHPQAWVSPSAKIDSGVIITAGCLIGANVRIHEGTILNLGVLLDHDVEVGRYSHLSIGVKISGGKKVTDFSFLEAGTVIGH